jgi:hypothetical protein
MQIVRNSAIDALRLDREGPFAEERRVSGFYGRHKKGASGAKANAWILQHLEPEIFGKQKVEVSGVNSAVDPPAQTARELALKIATQYDLVPTIDAIKKSGDEEFLEEASKHCISKPARAALETRLDEPEGTQ